MPFYIIPTFIPSEYSEDESFYHPVFFKADSKNQLRNDLLERLEREIRTIFENGFDTPFYSLIKDLYRPISFEFEDRIQYVPISDFVTNLKDLDKVKEPTDVKLDVRVYTLEEYAETVFVGVDGKPGILVNNTND